MHTLLSGRFNPVLQKRQGLALSVWGEAGIGKSYQVTELLQGLTCRSASLHATTPLSSFATMLPKPKKLPTWAERTLTRVEQGEASEAGNLTDALAATLSGLAPFVLHLEDLHEADAERTSFIQGLAQRATRIKGVGLVVTSRKEPLDPFTAFKLEPLNFQEVQELLERDLRAPLPKEAVTFIYDKAAGNPLYTLEYLRYLTRQGFLWNDGKSWHWRKPEHAAMPVTVEALIEQLLTTAKVEPLQRYVLETKAFLPLTTKDEVWSNVARVSEGELHQTVTELSRQGIFSGGHFAHPLFREVAFKTLTPERKQNLARRTMNVLRDNPAQAAAFVDDAKLPSEQALALLKKAAATKDQNAVTAARLLAKAASYAEGEEKNQLALGAATALQYHDLPLSQNLLEKLLRDEPHNIEALYLGTFFYARNAQAAKAEALFASLPEHERNSQRGIEALLEMNFLLDRHKEFLSLWEAHKTMQETFDLQIIRRAIYVIDGQLRSQEAIDLALKTLERTDLSEAQKITVLNPLAIAYHNSNQHEKAEEIFNRLVATPQHLLAGKGLRIILHNRALARKALGRYLEAKEDALENYRLASEAGDSLSVGKAHLQLGELFTELGDYEEAENHLSNSLGLLRQRDVGLFVLDGEVSTSLLYQAWASPHSSILALRHARTALALTRTIDYIHSRVAALFAASCAEAAFGQATTALELANELEGVAKSSTLPLSHYYAAWAKAKAVAALKQNEAVAQLLQQAYAVAENAKHVVNQHKIGLELDRLNNDVESARKRMRWFEERGLINGVNIAKRYFPNLAERKETPKQLENQVRLEVLGSLQVKKQTTLSVRGRKRQELLSLLLEARISGRGEVSRLTLFDTLYPDDDELKASGSLKNLVHSLRETLGENTITTTNNGYALGECSSDAELFLQTLDTALWRGTYLEDVELSDESTVRESLYLALFDKAKTLLGADFKEAARVGSILVDAEPYNTDYLKTYLTALRLSKNHGKLTRHYEGAKERLLEVGETLPETWQDFLTP